MYFREIYVWPFYSATTFHLSTHSSIISLCLIEKVLNVYLTYYSFERIMAPSLPVVRTFIPYIIHIYIYRNIYKTVQTRILLMKSTLTQQLKKFPTFHGTESLLQSPQQPPIKLYPLPLQYLHNIFLLRYTQYSTE